MWAWIVSIPLSIASAFLADKVQRDALSVVTVQNLQTYETPPLARLLQISNILVLLYFMLGWIPFVIFGVLHSAEKRKRSAN